MALWTYLLVQAATLLINGNHFSHSSPLNANRFSGIDYRIVLYFSLELLAVPVFVLEQFLMQHVLGLNVCQVTT